MRIIADTNIIVRFLVRDDLTQLEKVSAIFEKAQEIIIPTHVFCELVWVLSNFYKLKADLICKHLKALIAANKITFKPDEVQAGLDFMELGGDFADAVNAYSGRKMTNAPALFISFDQKAVRLLTGLGESASTPDGVLRYKKYPVTIKQART